MAYLPLLYDGGVFRGASDDRRIHVRAVQSRCQLLIWIDALTVTTLAASITPTMPPRRPDFAFERRLWRQDVTFIAGVDEVGRGPLAGPVAAGAVIFAPEPRFRWLKGVNDSKKLTAEAREELAPLIWEQALAASVSFVSAETVDRIGIAGAGRRHRPGQ
ncbi:MAG: hypothetical protein IIB85_00695 [Chloroflexi bacterium]|nr:hypothetical protein [Chloroflexota bacterium]